MGFRNHLHVCQHCGVVHATSSSTGPEVCVVCEAFTFSPSELNEFLRERDGVESGPIETDGERAKRTSSLVVQS